MNLDDRLRTHLSEPVAQGGPPLDPQRAIERHRQRQRHQRVGLAAVVLVVAAGMGALLTQRDSGERVVQTADPEAEAATDGAGTGPVTAEVQDLAIDWQAEPAGLGGYDTTYFRAGDLFYALSTAPGTTWENSNGASIPESIYRSDDGVNWNEQARFDDPWIVDLDTTGGELFYAVGTAPLVGSLGEIGSAVAISTSTDRGSSWNERLLPAAPPLGDTGLPMLGEYTHPMLAAVGDSAVVAVHTERPVDYEALVPEGQRPAGEEWWAMPETDGLLVIDDSPLIAQGQACAAAVEAEEAEVAGEVFTGAPLCENFTEEAVSTLIPWSELPAGADEDYGVDSMYLATAEGLEPVPWPLDGHLADLRSADAGVIAVTVEEPQSSEGSPLFTVWFSADGRAWDVVDIPAGESSAAGSLGDSLVTITNGFDGQIAVSTSVDGGASWAAQPLPGVGAGTFVSAATVTDEGIAVIVEEWGESDGESIPDVARSLYLSGDGAAWKVVDLGSILPTADHSVRSVYLGPEGKVFINASSFDPVGADSTSTLFVGQR